MKPAIIQLQALRNLMRKLTCPWALSSLLGLTVFVLYWPVTGYEFSHFDDLTYYVENAQVQAGLSWDNLVWAFTTDTFSNWHPLTWLSFMLDVELSNDPKGAAVPHFTNILFHAVNSGLLFLLLKRLTGSTWRSVMVAGLFAVHPLNVESVAWVSERKNVLSLCFLLGSLLAYVRYVRETQIPPSSFGGGMATGASAKFFYGVGLGMFALGLMSKPMVVTLPFILLLLDVWPLGRIQNSKFKIQSWTALVMEKWPFFLLSGLACLVTFVVQQHGHSLQAGDHFPLAGRMENALVSYVRYLGKTAWPVDLAIFYPHPGSWPTLQVSCSIVLLILISWVAVWSMCQRPYILMGWLWFLGTLVPVIGLIQAGTQAMADRYAYLPLIGIFIAVVWGGFDRLNRMRFPRAGLFLLGALFFLGCAGMARHQLGYWQNDGTLFGHALAVTQNNVQAEITFGVYLEKIKKPEEAARHYQAALAIDPTDKNAHFNLGNILDDEGQTEASIKEYRAAFQSDPAYYPAYYNLALVLERLGRRDEAIEAYNAALRIKPDFSAAKQHLQGLGVPLN